MENSIISGWTSDKEYTPPSKVKSTPRGGGTPSDTQTTARGYWTIKGRKWREKMTKEEKLKKEIIKLKRLINCVKDHPEIKPLNCCYQADTMMLKEYIKERKSKKWNYWLSYGRPSTN